MSSKNIYITSLYRLVLGAAICLPAAAPVWAQQQPQAVDADTMQALLKRIDQLETRVKQLEAERAPATPADSAQVKAPLTIPGDLPGMDGPPVANYATQSSAA